MLRAGCLELQLAPEFGGSIARFCHVADDGQRQHLMRPAAEDVADVLGMASFPLVPYANRIRGGAFDCDGETVRLAPNMAGDASPLHGQGWLHPWHVESADENTARLQFLHEAGEWPWRYEAWQDFTLDGNGLSLTLGCRNLSARRMPVGLAQHPYFPCNEQTTIDVTVSSAWTADAQTLPVEEVDATGHYELRNRRICGADLDNGFEAWDGVADFDWPGQNVRLRMTSPDASRFHVYAPVGQGYFAAEPVQNALTALNAPQDQWAALGMALLDEGQSHKLHVRFDVI